MMLARLLFATSLAAVAQASSRENLDNVSSKLMVHVSLQKCGGKMERRRSFRDPLLVKRVLCRNECPSRVMAAFVDENRNVWEIAGRCNRL